MGIRLHERDVAGEMLDQIVQRLQVIYFRPA